MDEKIYSKTFTTHDNLVCTLTLYYHQPSPQVKGTFSSDFIMGVRTINQYYEYDDPESLVRLLYSVGKALRNIFKLTFLFSGNVKMYYNGYDTRKENEA